MPIRWAYIWRKLKWSTRGITRRGRGDRQSKGGDRQSRRGGRQSKRGSRQSRRRGRQSKGGDRQIGKGHSRIKIEDVAIRRDTKIIIGKIREVSLIWYVRWFLGNLIIDWLYYIYE